MLIRITHFVDRIQVGIGLGALEADRNRCCEKTGGDKGEKENDVANSENALGQLGEVRHHSDDVDELEDRPENEPATLHVHQ